VKKDDLEIKLFDRPNSPLFARLADEYLAANRIDDAKKICTEGLKHFPGYGTAHLVLSKCHFVENNFALALACVENAQGCIPDPELLEGLCDELLAIISKGGVPQTGVERTMESEEVQTGTEADGPVLAVEEEELIPEPTEESTASLPEGSPATPSGETERKIESEETIEIEETPVAESDLGTISAAETVEEDTLESLSIEEIPEVSTLPATVQDEDHEERIPGEPVSDILPDVEPLPPQVQDMQIIEAHSAEIPPVIEETTSEIPVQGDQISHEETTEEIGRPSGQPLVEETAEPIPPASEKPDVPEYQPTETDRIITRTLAEIYASQKAYEEAIVTYRLLKEQKPERVEEIDARIAELRKLQQDRTKE